MKERRSICSSTIVITTVSPLPLVASANRSPRLSSGVSSPLEANVILFRDDVRSLALISLDVLFVGPSLVDDITNGLRALDIATIPEIVAVATHTHLAPMCD